MNFETELLAIRARLMDELVEDGLSVDGAALIIVYEMRASKSKHSHLLAFSQTELLTVKQNATSSRAAIQDELLEPFMMSPGRWRKKIKALIQS